MKLRPTPHLSSRPRGWRLALGAGMVTLALAASAATDPRASRLYEDALQRFDRKDYAGSIIQLKNALAIDNRNLAAQVLLGRSLLFNGDVFAAEVALAEGLRLGASRSEVVVPLARAVLAQGKARAFLDDPRFAPSGLSPAIQAAIHLLRAGAAADLGDAVEAMKSIHEARTLDPASPLSWTAEVPIRIRLGKFQEALDAANKALQLGGENAEALYVRGSVSHSTGKLSDALSWYSKALKVDSVHVEALVSRAGLLVDMKRFADAEADVGALLKQKPKEPRGLYLKAMLLDAKGDKAGTRLALQEVANTLDALPIEALKVRPQLLMLGGLAHHGLGQLEKAKPYLETLQRQQPGSPAAKLLARIQLKDKNLDRAIESLEGYLRAYPQDLQAVQLLASAHMSQGRYARAAQLTQDALKQKDSPEVRTLLGASLVGSGRLSDAVGELEAALKRDPDQHTAAAALAAIYLQAGRPARAVQLAGSLAAKKPRDPGVQNLLGTARAAVGDTAGARAAFETALKLDPNFLTPAIQIAQLEVAAGSFDAAAKRLDRVLVRDPKNVDAMLLHARMAERQSKLPEVQRWLEKADELAGPSNTGPGISLVDFHLRQGRPSEATAALKRVTTRAPEALPVLYAVARVGIANGDLTSARSALTRASNLAPRDAALQVRIAELQAQAGDLAGSAYSLEKALAERPSDVRALALQAEVQLRRGDLAAAEAGARQLVAKNPRLGIAHALLGDVAAARRQWPQAVDAYRKAHELERSDQSVLRLLGALLGTDPGAAAKVADDWLRVQPNDVVVRMALADASARQGNLAAARRHYEAIVAAQPNHADALNNLANIVVGTDPRAALALAERALAAAPQAPHVIGTTGWAALKAGQLDRALQLLRDARLRDPENPDTRYFLAMALATAGRPGEARAEAEAASKTGRPFVHAQANDELLRTLK